MRYGLPAISLALAAGLVAGCASLPDGSLSPLRVGLPPAYPPLAATDAAGSQGRLPGLARLAADAAGRPLELHAVEENELISRLHNGQLDLAASAPGQRPAPADRVLATHPFHRIGVTALVRTRDLARFTRPLDFKRAPLIVAAAPGTPGAEYGRVYCFGAVKQVPLAPREALAALQAGGIDAYLHDRDVLAELPTGPLAGAAVLPFDLQTLELVWLLPPRERALQRRLNRQIDRWRRETPRPAPAAP